MNRHIDAPPRAALAGILTALLLVAAGVEARAGGPVSATSTVDKRAIAIGDPVLLTLRVEAEAGYQVTDPGVPRAIGDFEVLETLPALQDRRPRGGTVLTFRYRVTTFTLGDRELPPFEVRYLDPGGAPGTVRTDALPISVTSVIAPGEDATDIKPLKPQLELPGRLLWLLARLSSALLVAASLAIAAALAVRRLRRTRPAMPAQPQLTPAQQALRELRRVAELRLPEQGRYREHYEVMGQALRRYLSEQFGLAALERTPSELAVDMESSEVDRWQASVIGEILRESEIVRFRNVIPYPRHAENALKTAIDAMRKAAAAEEAAARGYEVLRAGGPASR